MRYYLILSIGFVAQILFASRMIVQWLKSEQAGKVIAPTLFWQTSLIASFLLLVYGLLRADAIIVGGQLLSYFIYIRNLQLKNEWTNLPYVFRFIALALPVLLFVIIVSNYSAWMTSAFKDLAVPNRYVVAGIMGQLCLNLRFVYQWYWSEKIGRSFFPRGFWSISLAGAILIIMYATYRHDPVLFVAQSLGFVIYSRNLYLGRTLHE